MNFFKRFFLSKKDYTKKNIEWNGLLEKMYLSISEDDLKYPILLFCHVIWDFEVYNNPSEIIGKSISGHWGLFPELFDPKEIVIDSNGKVFKLSKEHYDEKTKIGFSYPSTYDRTENITFLKNKIIDGCNSYISYREPENTIEIKNNLELIDKMNSFNEIISYVKENLTDL